MANLTEEMVLTKDGVATLVEEILNAVNTRIQGRIVGTIDADSDANHTPAANVVYDAVKDVINIKYLVITDGDITKATIEPEEKVLYMVRKSAEDKEAVPYIYIPEVGFIAACGATSIQVGDTNITALAEQDIKDIVAAAVTNTDPGI